MVLRHKSWPEWEADPLEQARYVAKDYFRILEVDYQETFAPAGRMSSICT